MIKKLLELLGLKKKSELKQVQKVYRQPTKGKIVAHILYGNDINAMYGRKGDRNPGLCPVCHTVLKKLPNMEYKIRKKKGDLFETEDGFYIVTEKFKIFCEANKYENLKFTPLPKSPGYYFFEAETIFKTDPVKSWFEYGKKQECCKQYDWIVKGTRLWKDKNMHILTNDFISQSDYWLGDPKTKSPLIVIGTETARKMKKFDFFCIYFDNVMG